MLPTDIVPGTQFTPQQLCRTRSIKEGRAIKVGSIMARNGAYDRKYVVESITDLGLVEQFGKVFHSLAIVIRSLGHFYADGRFKPAVRPSLKQLEIEVPHDKVWEHPSGGKIVEFGYHLGGFVPVEPVGDIIKIKEIVKKKPVSHELAGAPVEAPQEVLDQLKM